MNPTGQRESESAIVRQYNEAGIQSFTGNPVHEFKDLESASFHALRRKVGSPKCALVLWECRNRGRLIIDASRNSIFLIHLH